MAQRYQPELTGFNQPDADLLARRRDLFQILADVAFQLLPFAAGKQEHQALHDARRGRLSGRTLYYMTRIDARRPFPSLAAAVEEAVFSEIAAPSVGCALEASLSEQRVNEPLNEAQLKAHDEKTPERWLHVAELCVPQEHATRQLRIAAIVRAGRGAR